MSFASEAKRRLPWLDVTELERVDRMNQGRQLQDAIADMVITLFEQLAKQSAERAPQPLALDDGACRRCGASPRWCECTVPLLGPGDT